MISCQECAQPVDRPAWRRARFCSGRCRTIYFNKRRPRGERHTTKACDPASIAPTLTDLAWAAGIWEGEGNISRGSECWRQRVCVVQKDTWILHKLKDLFGGSIYRSDQRCSAWYVSGPRARGFIYTIYSWLSPRRREQVRVALRS